MTIRSVPILLACLSVLPWLAGCGERRQSIRPQSAIEVPVAVYKPMPSAVTEPLAAPSPPPANCRVAGFAVPCALDGLAQQDAWKGVLERCNADRATAARLGKGTQP